MEHLFSSISVLSLEKGETILSKILVSIFRDYAPFDSWMLVQINSSCCPILVDGQNNFKPRLEHIKKFFQDDPTYKAILNGNTSEFITLSEVDIRRFLDTRYYNDCLKTRSGFSDQIGYLCPTCYGEIYLLTLSRSEAFRTFNECEVEDLRKIAPLVRAIIELIRIKDQDGVQPDQTNSEYIRSQHTEFNARNLNSHVLTRREQETFELLLAGETSKTIGRALGISPETVRCHIKRIYLKLDISSRLELYEQFSNDPLRSKAR